MSAILKLRPQRLAQGRSASARPAKLAPEMATSKRRRRCSGIAFGHLQYDFQWLTRRAGRSHYASLPLQACHASLARPSCPPRPDAADAPDSALRALLATLDLEPLEDNLFRGARGNEGWQRVYGGQVLGQALMAALAHRRSRRAPCTRCTATSSSPAIPRAPIVYDVERIRDGGSFTTRRVKAIQHGRAIFSMSSLVPQARAGLRASERRCRTCRRPRRCPTPRTSSAS